jgi:hypothetical protein
MGMFGIGTFFHLKKQVEINTYLYGETCKEEKRERERVLCKQI